MRRAEGMQFVNYLRVINNEPRQPDYANVIKFVETHPTQIRMADYIQT